MKTLKDYIINEDSILLEESSFNEFDYEIKTKFHVKINKLNLEASEGQVSNPTYLDIVIINNLNKKLNLKYEFNWGESGNSNKFSGSIKSFKDNIGLTSKQIIEIVEKVIYDNISDKSLEFFEMFKDLENNLIKIIKINNNEKYFG